MISPLSKYSTFKVGLFQVSCSMGADILFLQVPNWNYINQNQSASIRINQHQSAPISINQNNSESTRIIQNKLASISIHQHQSAPISINQNQSASININQVAWKCLQYCESMSSNLYLARGLNFFGKSICQHLDQNYIYWHKYIHIIANHDKIYWSSTHLLHLVLLHKQFGFLIINNLIRFVSLTVRCVGVHWEVLSVMPTINLAFQHNRDLYHIVWKGPTSASGEGGNWTSTTSFLCQCSKRLSYLDKGFFCHRSWRRGNVHLGDGLHHSFASESGPICGGNQWEQWAKDWRGSCHLPSSLPPPSPSPSSGGAPSTPPQSFSPPLLPASRSVEPRQQSARPSLLSLLLPPDLSQPPSSIVLDTLASHWPESQ